MGSIETRARTWTMLEGRTAMVAPAVPLGWIGDDDVEFCRSVDPN